MGQWKYGLSERGRGFKLRTSHVTLVTQSVTTTTTTPRPIVGRWLAALLLLVLAATAGVASAEFRVPRSVARRSTDSHDYAELRRNGICPSMDIRNQVSALSELENCTVVEGFVQILLIEQVNGTIEWQNYSFPNLREITGYLLLYRAFGLTSLRDLFPNLTVIRGQTLFYDYALVIYEMFQLREIGLASLTDIQRGSVRIEKNPYLCYVSTVDWDRIAKEGKGGHYIKDNMDPKECTPCPSHCPKSVDEQALCWTNEDCQKVCQNCKSCMLVGKTEVCCDDECLGGCTAPGNASQCTACQKVMQNGRCCASCIPGSYMFMERRCITDAECIRMPPPREHDELDGKPHHWKPFNGECVQKCPPKFTEFEVQTPNGTYYTCKECDGPCPKVCKGIMVNNIETAQSLKGCTTIDGVLQIQVAGGNSIVKELEDNLGSIELITGYVKVVRSFPLLSLNFLRNLREIRGQILDNNNHALVVMYNENLQELWNRETLNHSIAIHNGSVLFHFNPQLCLDKIDSFLKTAMPNRTFSNLEVAPTSNGDRAACNLKELEIRVGSQYAYGIVIEWDEFRMSDRRALIGYVISSREAPYQNVTYYDGRDACGGDGWRIGDKPPNKDENQTEVYFLTLLKPYTQYAIYVRTETVAAEGAADRVGARSKIIYVRTNATHPTSPEGIRAYPNSSSQLFIEWQTPKHPNGVVTHYIVWGEYTKDNEEYFDKSDHCLEHLTISAAKVPKASIEGSSPRESFANVTRQPGRSDQGKFFKGNRGDCCACDAGSKAALPEARDQEFRARFEDYLHNRVYVRAPETRAKRSTDASSQEYESDDVSKEDLDSDTSRDVVPPPDEIQDQFSNNHLVKFYRYVQETNITVSKLRHFSEYTIKVWACHDPKQGSKKKLCSSSVAVTSARTRASAGADIISNLAVDSVNETSSSKHIRIHWIDPLEVNGVILRYDIRYQRVEPEGARSAAPPSPICVRRKDFNTSERVYILKDLLHPGNYSFEVRVVSMKGHGPYTSPVYFTVEEKTSGMSGTLTAVVLGILFLVFCCIAAAIFALYWRRKINAGNVIVSLNPDYVSAVYRQDDWEVDRGNVELFRELGQGSFGMVYEGVLRNFKEEQEIRCAVKTVNEQASVSERIQFLNEASVMKQFSANHVVKLLGVVSLGQPTLVLMELMARGDLKTYLRSHRPDCEENVSQGRQPPTLRCILKMAIEIADGMAYLADKKFVHRDLAARNCMVADDLTVKIGDFGMTRDIYETDYYRKGGKGLLPVRWMAPESLRDGVFTTQSDIWSYGVVLWEMATLASQPYQGLSNEQVLKYVMDCGVMERPEGCPDRLYEIMETCWHYQPRHRPTFLDIIHNLLPDVPPQFAELSFYHSEAGVSARESQRSHQEQEQRKLHDPSTPLRFTHDHSPSRSSSRSSRSIDDHFLPLDPIGSREQALAIQEDETNGVSHPLAAGEDELVAEGQDHVQVMLAHDRRPYVVVRNPAFAANATNSKSDSSKSTTIPSEDSKGSYVSNGSAGNGYVMGILSRRRQGNTEC